jgi:hypothetical protein
MADILPRPADEVIDHASRAIGKIDLWGRRGVTMVSADEIEAMALMLAAFGLVPTIPGKDTPPAYFLTPSKEA